MRLETAEGRYVLTERGERVAVHGKWPCLSRVDGARLYLQWGGWRWLSHRRGAPPIRAMWHPKPAEAS